MVCKVFTKTETKERSQTVFHEYTLQSENVLVREPSIVIKREKLNASRRLDPNIRIFSEKKKIYFSCLNYCHSLNFLLELQTRVLTVTVSAFTLPFLVCSVFVGKPVENRKTPRTSKPDITRDVPTGTVSAFTQPFVVFLVFI